jgi:hypothetical protein
MTTKKHLMAAVVTPAKKSPAKKTKAPAKPAAKAPARTPDAAVPEQADKKAKKNHKEKVVRDSFTMPKSEYQKIAEIKEACLKAGMHVKKSEILRAGLKALCEKNDAQLRQSLRSLEKIQTGRPKKH